MAAIATKFALWEVPALDTLKDAKAYILRQKVNNKENSAVRKRTGFHTR